MYDADDIKIQPNGNVAITFEYADSNAEFLKVFYFNGTGVEEMSSCANNGSITLNANHFSQYIVAGVKANVIMPTATDFTVNFVENGGTAVDDQIITAGGMVTEPPEPIYLGHRIVGWYTDEELTDKWDFANDTVTNNVTLYAKYEEANCTVTFKTFFYKEEIVETQVIPRWGKATMPTGVFTPDGTEVRDWQPDTGYAFEDICDSCIKVNPYEEVEWDLYHNPGSWDFNLIVSEDMTLSHKDVQYSTLYAHYGSNTESFMLTSLCDVTKHFDGNSRFQYLTAAKFFGWYTDETYTTPFVFPEHLTQDTHIYAKLEYVDAPEMYVVTFYESNGAFYYIDKIQKDSLLVVPKINKDGFILEGWYTEPEFINKWNFDTDVVTGETNLYAKWLSDGTPTHTITFPNCEPSWLFSSSIELVHGAKITDALSNIRFNGATDSFGYVIDRPTKAGHVFIGWYKDANCTELWDLVNDTVVEDAAMYAGFEEETVANDFLDNAVFTVVAKIWDRTMTSFVEHELYSYDIGSLGGDYGWYGNYVTNQSGYSTAIYAPSQLYTYGSYKSGLAKIIGDALIMVNWLANMQDTVYIDYVKQPELYKVIFHENGGSTVDDIDVFEDAFVSEPACTKQDAKLEGWYTDMAFTNKWDFVSGVVSNDLTLYANWVYTIKFETNGGTAIADMAVTENAYISEPVSSKLGFELEGWYTDPSFTNKWDFSSNVVNQGMTLYAKWLPYYTISFETNGGTPLADVQVVEGNYYYGNTNTEKEGHKLEGWYTDPSFNTKWNFYTNAVTSDITLYAKWEAFNYTVGLGQVPRQTFYALVNSSDCLQFFTPYKTNPLYGITPDNILSF